MTVKNTNDTILNILKHHIPVATNTNDAKLSCEQQRRD